VCFDPGGESSLRAVERERSRMRAHILFPLRSQSLMMHHCETKGEMSQSTCGKCGDLMTTDNRVKKSVSKRDKQYYMSRCRTCIDESETILRQLKKENPQPSTGTPCDCCKRIDKLFCDHDHATGEFRNWICRRCNSGIGLLGDSEEGLRQALAYLERARPKSR
jgi:hypothetical protein